MSDKKPVCIIDGDYIRFAASAAGETRTIEVFTESGQLVGEYKTRTEFKALCKENNLEYSDYTIVDKQVAEPIANVLHTVKSMVQTALKLSGCDTYRLYLGKGESFRVERSTLIKYKANREGTIRPLLLGEVGTYMIKHLGAEVVEHIECDDKVVMECIGTNNVLIFQDKDFVGCPIKGVNIGRPEDGIINCNTFGKLWRDSKGKVRGIGRLFFYLQVASGDSSDNYKANCMSDIKWGEVAAYNALKDCKSDKEALTALVAIYRHLYPEPKVVTGWRGDLIDIDWLYCLEEVWMMAKMLKSVSELDNPITCRSILDKLGVNYE